MGQFDEVSVDIFQHTFSKWSLNVHLKIALNFNSS